MSADKAIQLRPAGDFFTPEQEQMIRDMFLSGAPKEEAAVLLELARVRKLNPITRQIHFVKRWDGVKKREVWSAQVGIDGFRTIAERTGLYDGQDEPEFEYDEKKKLKLCRVRVYRKGWSRPAVGVAHYSEYVQTKKEGGPNAMWARGEHFMLAKCAEASAFRKAFPEDTGGLYIPEEMGSETEAPPTTPPVQRTQSVKAQVVAKAAEVVDAKPAEPKALPPPKPANNYERLFSLMADRGIEPQTWGPELKKVMGPKRTKPSQVTDADVEAVLRSFPEPPPPDDAIPPPMDAADIPPADEDVPF